MFATIINVGIYDINFYWLFSTNDLEVGLLSSKSSQITTMICEQRFSKKLWDKLNNIDALRMRLYEKIQTWSASITAPSLLVFKAAWELGSEQGISVGQVK